MSLLWTSNETVLPYAFSIHWTSNRWLISQMPKQFRYFSKTKWIYRTILSWKEATTGQNQTIYLIDAWEKSITPTVGAWGKEGACLTHQKVLFGWEWSSLKRPFHPCGNCSTRLCSFPWALSRFHLGDLAVELQWKQKRTMRFSTSGGTNSAVVLTKDILLPKQLYNYFIRGAKGGPRDINNPDGNRPVPKCRQSCHIKFKEMLRQFKNTSRCTAWGICHMTMKQDK